MNEWANIRDGGERKYACDVHVLCINYSKCACDVFPYGKGSEHNMQVVNLADLTFCSKCIVCKLPI